MRTRGYLNRPPSFSIPVLNQRSARLTARGPNIMGVDDADASESAPMQRLVQGRDDEVTGGLSKRTNQSPDRAGYRSHQRNYRE